MRTNAPTRANTVSSTIAVDMGATSVRVVEIEFGGGTAGTLRVARRGVAPLPPGLWNDVGTHRDALTAAISQALSSAGIAGKTVVACMPRRMVTLRFVRLPHAPPEQMRGMVEFEAQQYVLFPLDDVILDYHVVTNPLDAAGVGLDDMDTVLLAGARRSLINDIMAAFDRAGLELLQLSASALALAENGRDSLEPTALIDVEPGEIDVAMIADGQLLFTRASALDVQGVRPEVAERREVEEVIRSFTAYQNEFRSRPIAHVFVGGESGSGATGESLDRALTEMLEMTVTPLVPRGLPPGDMEGRAWATAIGMAMQSRSGSIAAINLVPNERAERKARQARTRQQRLFALAGMAGAAAFIYLGVTAYSKTQATAKLALSENMDLQANTDRLTKLQKDHDQVKTVADEVQKGLDRNHPIVDILYALNRALPTSADIWLTQFQFDRSGLLTIHGETKKAIAATQLVLAMQKSGAFTNVNLGFVGDSIDNTQQSSPLPAPAPVSAPASGTSTAGTVSGAGAGSATAAVPQLPGPTTPGLAGGNRGAVPTTFTPNPALAPNGNPGQGGGFQPNRGGGGTGFNPGGGGVNPSGTPRNFSPPSGGQNAAPPVIITPVAPPSGAPGSRAVHPDNGRRQASRNSTSSPNSLSNLNSPNGHLILAGWQAPAFDPNAQGGGGTNPDGTPRRRGRRNRDANGNIIPYDPNNPNGGGQSNPNGGTPGGTPNTPPASPYTSGSIFGATSPTVPPVNPPNGNGGGNPGDNGVGRRRRFGGFGGFNGPVPAITTPPGGIQRAPIVRKPLIVKPAALRTNQSKQTLTSFVITCRVNIRRKDLVPADAALPAKTAADSVTAKRSNNAAPKTGAVTDNIDNGGDDADTQ